MHIYVGNLAFAVTEAELRAAFEAYGAVDAVRLITDQSSGQSKGFGFAEMPAASEAQAAIAARLTTRRVGLLTRALAPPTAPRSRPFG
jgi:hypothetical protein